MAEFANEAALLAYIDGLPGFRRVEKPTKKGDPPRGNIAPFDEEDDVTTGPITTKKKMVYFQRIVLNEESNEVLQKGSSTIYVDTGASVKAYLSDDFSNLVRAVVVKGPV